jgi:DNA-binding MarR family transcriptional regulator
VVPAERRPPAPSPVAPEADRLSADALEASRLVLELIHAAYPSREPASPHTSVPGHVVDGQPLSRGAIRASIHLYQRSGTTMGELAAALGMSNGWASRVVEELVRAGLAERSTDPMDRRVVHVALTAAASDFVASAYRWRGEAVERALEGLDEDGRRAVIRFLARAVEELQPGS